MWSMFSLEKALSILSLSPITTGNVDDGGSLKKTITSISSDQNNKTKHGDPANTVTKNLGLFSSAKATEYRSPDTVPWGDMIIKGPSAYPKMRKLFDDALITCKGRTYKVTRKYYNDNWKLKVENASNFDCLKLNVHRKMRMSAGIFSPFLQIGDESNVGLKIKKFRERGTVSFSTGISIKNHTIDESALWYSVAFRYPDAVFDTKVKIVPQSVSQSMIMKTDVSGVLGHNFGKFGCLAGFNVALDTSEDFRWKDACRAISMGIVSPTVAQVLTIQPNDRTLTFESCVKKNSIELVSRAKTNYTSPIWNARDHEVGLKFKHTENVAFSVKSDFVGNVTGGAWIRMPSFKVGLLAKTSMVGNIGVVESYEISVEI